MAGLLATSLVLASLTARAEPPTACAGMPFVGDPASWREPTDEEVAITARIASGLPFLASPAAAPNAWVSGAFPPPGGRGVMAWLAPDCSWAVRILFSRGASGGYGYALAEWDDVTPLDEGPIPGCVPPADEVVRSFEECDTESTRWARHPHRIVLAPNEPHRDFRHSIRDLSTGDWLSDVLFVWVADGLTDSAIGLYTLDGRLIGYGGSYQMPERYRPLVHE